MTSPKSPSPQGISEAAAPWNVGKLEAVLTSVLYEHFTERSGSFTFSAYGRDETYELLDGDPDDGVLTFERKSDGARFEVEFWANVTAVTTGKATQ